MTQQDTAIESIRTFLRKHPVPQLPGMADTEEATIRLLLETRAALLSEPKCKTSCMLDAALAGDLEGDLATIICVDAAAFTSMSLMDPGVDRLSRSILPVITHLFRALRRERERSRLLQERLDDLSRGSAC